MLVVRDGAGRVVAEGSDKAIVVALTLTLLTQQPQMSLTFMEYDDGEDESEARRIASRIGSERRDTRP